MNEQKKTFVSKLKYGNRRPWTLKEIIEEAELRVKTRPAWLKGLTGNKRK